MAQHVFISYSNHDKSVADAVCAALENRKVRCWIAPRDVMPGVSYADALIDGLNKSRLLVLVFSSNSNTSSQVMREVERAVSKNIPIITFRIEDVPPSRAMEYFLSAHQWLDGLIPPITEHIQRLADTVVTQMTTEIEKLTTATQNSSASEPEPENRVILFLESALRDHLDTNPPKFTRELLKAIKLDTKEHISNLPIISWKGGLTWRPRYDILYPQCYVDPSVTTFHNEESGVGNSSFSFSDHRKDILRKLASSDSTYYVLIGESGIGKTTTLLTVYDDFLREHDSDDLYFPILLQARDIAATTLYSEPNENINCNEIDTLYYLWDICIQVVSRSRAGVRKDAGELWVSYGGASFPTTLLNTKPVFFFDAIDEVDEAVAKSIMRVAPRVSHMLTSRTDYFHRTATHLYESGAEQVYYLTQWGKKHVLQFVDLFLTCSSTNFPSEFPRAKVVEIQLVLRTLNIENTILVKPLFLIMFIVIAQQCNDTSQLNALEITSSPHKLYETFLRCWFEKETSRPSSKFKVLLSLTQREEHTNDAVIFGTYRNILEYIGWCLFYQKHGVIQGIPFPLQCTEELISNNFRGWPSKNVPFWGEYISYELVRLAETEDIKSILEIENKSRRLVKFIHESIGDYMVASSFVHELAKQRFNTKVLANYYPKEITQFINELVADPDGVVFNPVIRNLKLTIQGVTFTPQMNEIEIRQSNWALYFLSRALFARTGVIQKQEDLDVFRAITESAAHPWLKRTAYISLIILGDTKYERRYLQALIKDELEQEYNIGDMLRYYGDIHFQTTMRPDDIRIKRESLISQTWTRCYLRLLRGLSSKDPKDRQLIKFRMITFLIILYSLRSPVPSKDLTQIEMEAKRVVDSNMGNGFWKKSLEGYRT